MTYLSFYYEGTTPELQAKARKELGETEEIRVQALKELRSLIKAEEDFNPRTDEFFLLRFLRAKKFNVDKAFNKLKKYYIFKAQYSGILTDLTPSDIRPILDLGEFTALPYRDAHGAGIGIVRMGNYDIEKTTGDDILGAILVSSEICMELFYATQVCGYQFILDFSKFDLRTTKHYASPTLLYRTVTAIQDCIPCRVKGFHIVNEPLYFSVILNILKVFMSDKLRRRIHVHGSNMKTLHAHIPPEILPSELGGKLGTVDPKVFNNFLCSREDLYIKMNKYGFTGKKLQQLRNESGKNDAPKIDIIHTSND